MDIENHDESLLTSLNNDDEILDYPEPDSLYDSHLPWMPTEQPLPSGNATQSAGLLIHEGFVPSAFPPEFSFVNQNTAQPFIAPQYPYPAIQPTPPTQPDSPDGSSAATPNHETDASNTEERSWADADEGNAAEGGVFTGTRSARVGRPRKQHAKRDRPKGSGKRGGWSKGMKLGPRPVLEPGSRFSQLHGDAMNAFLDHNDVETAQKLILEAININPEIFSAHALLAETYLSQGEQAKAVTAMWMGAHTFPRDISVWQQCADMVLQRTNYTRKVAWSQASYALKKVVGLAPGNMEARFQYATALREIETPRKAITQLDKIFNVMPHNSSCLRLYSKCAQDLGKIEAAINSYKTSISHYMQNGMTEDDAFEWGDVEEYVDLIARKKGNPITQITTAIKVCKKLARWLLGRIDETYWDEVIVDDREWDAEDEPRRAMVHDYQPDRFDQGAYGLGLPLEIRAQLGILRLRLGGHREEALGHFEWLEPDGTNEDATVHEFSDLFLRVATALNEAKEHLEALRFYEPLLQIKAFRDHAFYVGAGTSSYICGKTIQAMECFEGALAVDEKSIDARTYISKVHVQEGDKEKAFKFADEAVQLARAALPKTDRRKYEKKEQRLSREAAEAALKEANRMAGPRPKRSRKRKRGGAAEEAGDDVEAQVPIPGRKPKSRVIVPAGIDEGERVRQLYDTLEYNSEAMRAGNEVAKNIWIDCAKDLTDTFIKVKVFFPADPNERFMGYQPKRRTKRLTLSGINSETQSALPSPSPFSADYALPSIETLDAQEDEPSTPPSDFHSIDFSDWLNVFLEYALVVANDSSFPVASRRESSYRLVNHTLRCAIYRHSPKALHLAHVTWLACALAVHDENTLFNTILRWFIKASPFCTDAYRLFGAINFLFPHSKQVKYNGEPVHMSFQSSNVQKFLFRHIVSIDHYLPPDYTSPNDGYAPVPEFMRHARPEHISLHAKPGVTTASTPIATPLDPLTPTDAATILTPKKWTPPSSRSTH